MKTFKTLVLAFVMIAFSNIIYAQNQTISTDTNKTVKLKVKGITCSNDLKTISGNVEKLDGVVSCKTGKMGATSSFEVTFNPLLVSEKEINEAIENTAGCEDPNEKPYRVKL